MLAQNMGGIKDMLFSKCQYIGEYIHQCLSHFPRHKINSNNKLKDIGLQF